MKKVIVSSVVCVIVVLYLVACSGGGSSSNNNSNATSIAMKGTSGNAVNMNGMWTRCERNVPDQNDSLLKATINGVDITLNVSMWNAPTSAHCLQTATPDATMTITMTATLGAEAAATWTDGSSSTSPPVGVPPTAKATQETSVYKSATMTLNTTSWANNANSISQCGKTNWAVGVPTDVLNCTAVINSTTVIDYWVVDDSSTPLKLYNQNIGTAAYQVDSINPLLK
jgi:hypothetical protein